jgi:opacity protein-like surface antigen
VKENWLSTFRGRVGYAQGNWLIYATAGGALANVENSIVGPPGTVSEKHAHWGWTAGGGVEVKLNPDWSAKVEYLYVGLQDKSYFNPAPSVLIPSNQGLRLDDHIVRVGVNYKLPWSVLDNFFKR